MGAPPEVGMSFARVDGEGSTETEVRALMKVLIGVDPHKASLAVAAVEATKGGLLERASFPQDRAGLRSLDRWANGFTSTVVLWRAPEASVGTWRGGGQRPANP